MLEEVEAIDQLLMIMCQTFLDINFNFVVKYSRELLAHPGVVELNEPYVHAF